MTDIWSLCDRFSLLFKERFRLSGEKLKAIAKQPLVNCWWGHQQTHTTRFQLQKKTDTTDTSATTLILAPDEF
ncbi:hypothetical protein HMPREF0765_1158 [Sphingobacterium spiritivorum ATCC 33300]|uniref:Uncharacterized protein n=1 Tax=Sphingobacterium spiritivorum ATCC 33300 TaxID=525372 RepID=C2FV02_SPHSI|nr:hypothetical protein HMPREF0765_1158 [Sphingobacterium spiritivorum ATCC 33300]